jgi:hypothetical protein
MSTAVSAIDGYDFLTIFLYRNLFLSVRLNFIITFFWLRGAG